MSVYAMSYVFFDFGGTIGNELRSEKRLLRNLATNTSVHCLPLPITSARSPKERDTKTL